MWISTLAEHLNLRVLPPGYLALTTVSFGGRLEVDVPTVDRNGTAHAAPSQPPAESLWGAPQATLTLPAVMPDTVETKVFHTEAGNKLVAAIELVSPANKDRPAARQAFVAKCVSYLFAGVGLIIVDVVTTRVANLHNELVRLIEQPASAEFPPETVAYAASYHPIRSEDGQPPAAGVEFWPRRLAIGDVLPTLPLALRGGPAVPVDFEVTYMEARRRQRL